MLFMFLKKGRRHRSITAHVTVTAGPRLAGTFLMVLGAGWPRFRIVLMSLVALPPLALRGSQSDRAASLARCGADDESDSSEASDRPMTPPPDGGGSRADRPGTREPVQSPTPWRRNVDPWRSAAQPRPGDPHLQRAGALDRPGELSARQESAAASASAPPDFPPVTVRQSTRSRQRRRWWTWRPGISPCLADHRNAVEHPPDSFRNPFERLYTAPAPTYRSRPR